MELKDFESKYIYTTKLIINEEDYIILREPNVLEMKEYGEDVQKNIEILRNVFEKCIIEHSFTKDGQQVSNKELVETLKKSVFLFNEILNEWMTHIPLTKRLQVK